MIKNKAEKRILIINTIETMLPIGYWLTDSELDTLKAKMLVYINSQIPEGLRERYTSKHSSGGRSSRITDSQLSWYIMKGCGAMTRKRKFLEFDGDLINPRLAVQRAMYAKFGDKFRTEKMNIDTMKKILAL